MRSLHVEAMCWLRYGKRMPIVCTEVGPWNADILGLSDKMSIEVEIKKSRSDLLAEFRNKRAKHYAYANALPHTPFVPNYLYFFVPEALGAGTVEVINAQAPKAGVAVLTDTNLRDGCNVTVIKKPTRLRADPPRPGFLSTAVMRMSSELCHTQLALEAIQQSLEAQIRQIGKDVLLAGFRSTGALDMECLEESQEERARELKRCVEGIDIFHSEEDKAKWIAAAGRYLEAQYCNSQDWSNAAYNRSKR